MMRHYERSHVTRGCSAEGKYNGGGLKVLRKQKEQYTFRELKFSVYLTCKDTFQIILSIPIRAVA